MQNMGALTSKCFHAENSREKQVDKRQRWTVKQRFGKKALVVNLRALRREKHNYSQCKRDKGFNFASIKRAQMQIGSSVDRSHCSKISCKMLGWHSTGFIHAVLPHLLTFSQKKPPKPNADHDPAPKTLTPQMFLRMWFSIHSPVKDTFQGSIVAEEDFRLQGHSVLPMWILHRVINPYLSIHSPMSLPVVWNQL